MSLAAMVGISCALGPRLYTRGIVRLCQGALDEDLTPGPADRMRYLRCRHMCGS